MRTDSRRGDNAQLAKVSFVDDFSKKVETKSKSASGGAKEVAKKTEKPEVTKTAKVVQSDNQKISTKTSATQAAKRTGRRGDR